MQFKRAGNRIFSRDIPNHNKITITFCNLPYVSRNKNYHDYLTNVVKPNEFVYTLLTAICHRERCRSGNACIMMDKCKSTVVPFDSANHDAIVFNITDHSTYMPFIDKRIT